MLEREIPENWISIEQKDDLNSFFTDLYNTNFNLPNFSNNNVLKNNKTLIKVLINSGYDSEEKIKNFFKTQEGLNFFNLISNFSELFLKLLLNREINTIYKINYFLKDPQGTDFYDPFLLPNMDEAVQRILFAIRNKENILIYGDYDADGVISTVLLFNFLKKIGLEPTYNIPDRIKDGYDINLRFIKKLRKRNPEISLVICVDCGTNSAEVKDFVIKSNEKIDVIVCDHHKILKSEENQVAANYHSIEDENKNKYIIINPQLSNSKYEFKFLSGAGVTFKFIHATLTKLDKELKEKFEKNYLTNLLDLVAISTIADLMPLIDENRIIVKKGLKILKNTKNDGLKALIKSVLPLKQESGEFFNTFDIGFIIAPRINAPGRVEEEIKNNQNLGLFENVINLDEENEPKENSFNLNIAKKSFELLISNSQKAEKIVNEINELNEKRKNEQAKILEEILTNKDYDFLDIQKNQKIFIEKSKNWSEGLLGIVASDLVKRFNIPVILFKENEDNYKGSGRSIEEFDLFENLQILKDFLDKFGGHKMACGVLIKSNSLQKLDLKQKFELFKREMIKLAKEKLKEVKIQKKFYYDLEIEFDQIKASFSKDLKLLEPFGIGNTKPVFLTKNCFIKDINFLKEEKHVVLQLKNKGIYKKAIYFNISKEIAQNLKKISKETPISIIYNIEENTYDKNNNKDYNSLQLVILDLFC